MKTIIVFSVLGLGICLLGGLVLIGALYHPAAVVPPELKGQHIFIGGNKIRYHQFGQGKDILFIHGCPGSIEDWDPIVQNLSEKYRLTLYDRPGFGYGENKTDHYTVEANVKTALELINALDLKDVLIVGHSYGTSIALQLAIQDAANISGYVLIGPAAYGPVDLDPITRLLSIPYLGKGMSVIFVPMFGKVILQKALLLTFAVENLSDIPTGFLELRSKIWLQPKVAITRAEELKRLEKELTQMSKSYSKIKKKLFLIQGQDDIVTRSAWKLHEDVPNSELLVLENVGHYPHLVHPKRVTETIEKALRKNF